ncbi:hypothetical protein DSECCO2_582070 [anaerobic digester metagenome]
MLSAPARTAFRRTLASPQDCAYLTASVMVSNSLISSMECMVQGGSSITPSPGFGLTSTSTDSMMLPVMAPTALPTSEFTGISSSVLSRLATDGRYAAMGAPMPMIFLCRWRSAEKSIPGRWVTNFWMNSVHTSQWDIFPQSS